MNCGFRIQCLVAAVMLSSAPGTTISGRLKEGGSGNWLGGEGALVVAYVQTTGTPGEIGILGYTHPDGDGKWSIPELPAGKAIFITGFHRDFPDTLMHREVVPDSQPLVDLGTLQTSSVKSAVGSRNREILLSGPDRFRNMQNSEVAATLTAMVQSRQVMEQAAAPAGRGGTGSIEGLWERRDRMYRITGDRAEIVATGAALKSSATAGTVVMRNIRKTGDNTWSAEVLWQLDVLMEWSSGSLTLSSDGRTLVRISTSPWAGTSETVIFSRK